MQRVPCLSRERSALRSRPWKDGGHKREKLSSFGFSATHAATSRTSTLAIVQALRRKFGVLVATEAKEIFDANTRSLKELLCQNGLGLYIPAYQRPYGWDKTKVTRLIDDTLHGLASLPTSPDTFTFLGTVITIHDTEFATVHPAVRNETPSKVLTIIDGQQRLSTLLALTACLHAQIRVRHWRLFKGSEPPQEAEALTYLHDQTRQVLAPLLMSFAEAQQYGDVRIYPRMIRAFVDQWARKSPNNIYESPLAHLTFSYAASVQEEDSKGIKPTDYRAKTRHEDPSAEGEADLVRRYNDIRSYLNRLAVGEAGAEDMEALPPLALLAGDHGLQKATLGHEMPIAATVYLQEEPVPAAAELARLLILAAYVLNRIALTVVQGKDENYAFTIFESLNTTGEPLTAIETFGPRVVQAEGLAEYSTSEARKLFDDVRSYVEGFRAGDQRQNATRDLLVAFALAESGHPLSKRLADQRSYLKDEFERYIAIPQQRLHFLASLRDTSALVRSTWTNASEPLPDLPADSTTDTIRLCMSFLRQLNHSVTLGLTCRYYSRAVRAEGAERLEAARDFESVLKAVTAFTILWRGSRRTTGNIDQQHRQLMSGTENQTGLSRLARSSRGGGAADREERDGLPAVSSLRAELVTRLAQVGGVRDRVEWLLLSRPLPHYSISSTLTRFMLLAAYHDSVEDDKTPGLLRHGKPDANPCLNWQSWNKLELMTIEHVAPQQVYSPGWASALYTDKELVDRLGNLCLTPKAVNSSLGARPWNEKRVLYGALGARTKEEALAQLEAAQEEGVSFVQSTEELVNASHYMPHLVAVGQRPAEWTPQFVDERTERLLGLVWDRLRPWLEE